jgi:hypothetical protein
MALISVVTPTFRRPIEAAGLLESISRQTILPSEVILVDGAPDDNKETEQVVSRLVDGLPFRCRYVRHARGTAIQRNAGRGREPMATAFTQLRAEWEAAGRTEAPHLSSSIWYALGAFAVTPYYF